MDFSAKHCKKSLDFALAEGNEMSSVNNANSDHGSSSSSQFSEKLGDDDHMRFDVKEIPRRKLQEKTKSLLAEVDLLQKWHSELSVMGFSCEILNLTTKHSPLAETEPPTHCPEHVLVLYPSNVYTYTPQTGPFQPVRLIVYVDGKWNLQCPIYRHMVVKSGTLETRDTCYLLEVAKEMLCGDHTLCPGIMEDISVFGYDLKGVMVTGPPVRTTHAESCKVSHVPSSRQNVSLRSSSLDPRWRQTCSKCLKFTRYVKRRAKAREVVDGATKSLRHMPHSHCPWKFLSPNSKAKRSRNARQQRTRLQKQVLKFYKRTKVELPANQSNELCQLIQAIENCKGKKELDKIKRRKQTGRKRLSTSRRLHQQSVEKRPRDRFQRSTEEWLGSFTFP